MEVTNLIAYSGPLVYYFPVDPDGRVTYSGPLQYFQTNPLSPRTNPHAYTGPLTCNFLTPGHFIYDSTADFNTFGGVKTVADGTIRSTSPDYITYGPVENGGMGTTAGIDRVIAYFNDTADPTAYISVSIRASNTAFAANNTSIAWGEWWPLGGKYGMWETVAGGGAGNYVQVRVQFTAGTGGDANVPTLERLEIWVEPEANSVATSDVLCRINTSANQARSNKQAKIRVRFNATPSDIPARIKFQKVGTPDFHPAKIKIVEQAISNIRARMFVRQQKTSFIPARIRLPQSGEITSFIPARVNITRATVMTNMQRAKIRVRQVKTSDIRAKLFMKAHLIPARIRVKAVPTIPSSFIKARIYVRPDQPTAVANLHANVPAATWQPSTSVTFAWDAATPATTPIAAYYYLLTDGVSPPAIDTWATTTSLTRTETIPSIGKWFFHIAARNTAGIFGPESVYEVWLNHKPSAPGSSLMKVDGQDTILQSPVLPASASFRHFTWSASTDADPSESSTLKYQLQIAFRSDFAFDDELGTPSIVLNAQNLTIAEFNLTQNLKSGTWFWRIRASDTKEYSEWSQVGSFRVNRPPGRPLGMLVEDY